MINKQFMNRNKVVTQPFPYVVIKNFLPQVYAKDVLAALQCEPMQKKDSDLFRFSQTKDIDGTKSKVLQDMFNKFSASEFVAWVSKMMKTKLNGVVDMSGFVYHDGDYLLCHDDRLDSRRIAYVYNLSERFARKNGGSLDLMNTSNGHPTKVVKRIMPTFNTLTMFSVSKKSFHQVAEVIKNDRWSLAGWFHG